MIALSEKDVTEQGFEAMGHKLNPEGKRLALRGALMVAGADGSIGKAEQKFIGGPSTAFGVGGDELNAILGHLFGRPQGATA